MTEIAEMPPLAAASDRRARLAARLKRRYAAERRFRAYGIAALAVALLALASLFFVIFSNASGAFRQSEMLLEIEFDAAVIDPEGRRDIQALSTANYAALVNRAMRELFPDVSKRRDRRALRELISVGAAFDLRAMVLENPGLIGQRLSVWLPASADADLYVKGGFDPTAPGAGRLSERQGEWLSQLSRQDRLERKFNWRFFTAGDSREPELAGIWGAVVGSFYALLVCLALAFPLGVMTAVYLQEFAPKNRWIDLVEVNINNLAAVPSIVFGLLGLAVLLGFFGMPRSAPLVGGIVLALMTLPTVIIAARAALQAVPPSIREAALGIGASPIQVVTHHVLPLAMPGVLTGTIIGMAGALGETAPLLMIGMVAFIVDIPGGPTDPATALPVQIFLWADAPERAFAERTAAAIVVLLGFLALMNLSAVLLRRRFERRW